MTNKKDLNQAKRFILSGIRKQESENLTERKIEMTIKLRKVLYSNYKESNDKLNWKMDTMDFLIYFESQLEGLSYKRIHDKQVNELVMSLIGFIKSNGFETITEVKG